MFPRSLVRAQSDYILYCRLILQNRDITGNIQIIKNGRLSGLSEALHTELQAVANHRAGFIKTAREWAQIGEQIARHSPFNFPLISL